MEFEGIYRLKPIKFPRKINKNTFKFSAELILEKYIEEEANYQSSYGKCF